MKKYVEQGYDEKLIKATQPEGNVSFENSYVRKGDGYMNCLHLYDYPSSGLSIFWQAFIAQQPNTIAIMDVGTMSSAEARKKIRSSMREIRSRKENDEESRLQQGIALGSQQNLLEQILEGQTITKLMHFRLFIYGDTVEELDERTGNIRHELNNRYGIKSAVYILGEQKMEFQSILLPYTKQLEQANEREGAPFSSRDLAGGYPFDYTSLEDPTGTILGFTPQDGPVIFDLNQRTNKRTRSTIGIFGQPGMGKSAFLKKILEDQIPRGNYIRSLTLSNEYRDLMNYEGGVSFDLSGQDGTINPFEVMGTITKDTDANSDEADEKASFYAHIDKLNSMYSFLDPDANADRLNTHREYLIDFYKEGVSGHAYWPQDPENHPEDIHVLGLPHEQYPRTSDFINFLMTQYDRAISQHLPEATRSELRSIINTYKAITTEFPTLFNKFTTFPDFEKVQIVSFEIEKLAAMGDNIFAAEIFNLLYLLNAQAVSNGKKQRRLLKQNKINEDEVVHYVINIDECHRILNSKMPASANLLANMQDEMRKYYCGIMLATPQLQTILPAGRNETNQYWYQDYMRNLKRIFSGLQYRVFFNMDETALPQIKEILGNSITSQTLESLPKFEKFNCLMNINGDQNIQFKTYLTNAEQRRYG